MILDGEIRKQDNKNLLLSIDGREYKIDIWDIKRVIAEGQKKAQVKKIRIADRNQTVLGGHR